MGIFAQLSLLAMVGVLAMVPPAQGRMLVIPLLPVSQETSAAWTVAAQARLIGAGPLPGALIVDGPRHALLPAALRHGALLINTNFVGCAGTNGTN